MGKNSKSLGSIDAMIRRFNQVSMWVATEIVVTMNVKKRASLIKHFILIAKEAEKLNNFNSLLEITAGLNLSMIQRLRKTWKVCILQSSLSSFVIIVRTN